MRKVPLARRNLFQDRRRAALAISGVAVALLLVIVLDGIFAGAMRQVTAYIESSPADLIVSQAGVRTMHMSTSALPPEVIDAIRAVPGVASADPIRFTTAVVHASSTGEPSLDPANARSEGRQLSYLIGYDTATGRGGPSRIVGGSPPLQGEIVIDEVAADQLGVHVGDRVEALGTSFAISGLSTGGTSIVNSTAFIPTDDFARLRGTPIAYVFVAGRPGIEPKTLARRIERAVPDVTVQTRDRFASEEGRIVRDMAADVMQVMTLIGLLIALAVVALTLFSVTLAKLREYGVAKALGARAGHLTLAVVAQALWTIGLSLAGAVGLALVLGGVVGRVSPTVSIVVEPGNAARVGIEALAIGAVGAALPLRRVLRVDPASVFRGV